MIPSATSRVGLTLISAAAIVVGLAGLYVILGSSARDVGDLIRLAGWWGAALLAAWCGVIAYAWLRDD